MPLFLPVLNKLVGNVNSPADSGRALANLVESDNLEKSTGAYYEGYQCIRSSDESYLTENWARLWRTSERLSRLDDAEKLTREVTDWNQSAV